MMVRLGGVFTGGDWTDIGLGGAMRAVGVPDPGCAGCLGDGRCWVCVGQGRLRSAGAPDVDCHICGGSGACATCLAVVDLTEAERAPQSSPTAPG